MSLKDKKIVLQGGTSLNGEQALELAIQKIKEAEHILVLLGIDIELDMAIAELRRDERNDW